MSILDEIVAYKKEIVQKDSASVSQQELIAQLGDCQDSVRGFRQKILATNAPAIIAEIKKASPSHGLIRENFSPTMIAKNYLDGGAACLSVLTDEKYFRGHNDFLMQIRKTVPLPLLRKDFIISTYQIYQSRLLGADCILLIAAILSDAQMAEFNEVAKNIGLDVLIEIHDQNELERVLPLKPDMIGVNNRNLKTLKTNLQTTEILAKNMPKSITLIAESGLVHPQDLRRAAAAGADGFLIGESLMKQDDIAHGLQSLIDSFRATA